MKITASGAASSGASSGSPSPAGGQRCHRFALAWRLRLLRHHIANILAAFSSQLICTYWRTPNPIFEKTFTDPRTSITQISFPPQSLIKCSWVCAFDRAFRQTFISFQISHQNFIKASCVSRFHTEGLLDLYGVPWFTA